jgi:aryl-alcohol dehydrogenase-like predicted oxidoreductase
LAAVATSEIGYGAWGIGGSMWIGAQEEESVRALHRAIELGVNFIDTARGYGESERIVGKVVRDHRGEPLYVATKVPPKNGIWPAPRGLDPAETFPGDHIRASLETSLRASGLEAFDVLQFHVWSDEWVGRGDWLETVEDLKKQGKIRFFGVSINDYQPDNVLELVRSGHVNTVQCIYNAFHQAPEERLHVDALTADLGIETDQVAEIALRYVLSQDAISTVIAGMRTVRNVERNAAVGDGRSLAAGQRAIVAKHAWEKNFYPS